MHVTLNSYVAGSNSISMYKVRFNLRRGKTYMKWKVAHTSSTIADQYVDPSEFILKMDQCRLKNKKEKAMEIFDGANKDVCAWIECANVEILAADRVRDYMDEVSGELTYSPRNAPHWTNQAMEDCDDRVYPEMVTIDKGVFAISKLFN